ncbi:hypothetical protein SAMN05421823_102756 [Catalinimonas alkaloidigena]|uniref:DUF985 domain-containing protein n=1 Tax=Catalinimonas alkaloidigena TaxID=1075417 RepID=A0A1G9BZI0_9BACT|nr:cupin domain-containing protein [Catalinimonas alkaloidigena]SDK44847.1 hypothetical protein SAMN05421823_102756 [Catalinimonas alkaloidigena]
MESWIEQLGLQAHPEGGWYRELYRADESVAADALPARYGARRTFGTAIYYLLDNRTFSAFHRILSDEIWHFYAGDPLTLYVISPAGDIRTEKLGPKPMAGEQFQLVIPHGHWFAARVEPPGRYALLGCTVSPGFDFADFELAERAALLEQYPQHTNLIRALTRETA